MSRQWCCGGGLLKEKLRRRTVIQKYCKSSRDKESELKAKDKIISVNIFSEVGLCESSSLTSLAGSK